MGFFKRLNDIVSANFNDLLDRMEDPDRVIRQLIREMEENIAQAREGVVEAIASEKELHGTLQSNRQIAAMWNDKARQAVQQGNEAMARSALERKKENEQAAASLQPAWETAHANAERLKAQLHQLEQKLAEAKHKRATLSARQKVAEAQQKMNHTAALARDNFDTENRFARMEDKVTSMELHAQAMAELNDHSPLEEAFLKMQIEEDVEQELEALKQELAEREAKEQ